MKLLKTILTGILAAGLFILQAQEIPEKPVPPRLVNDFSGILLSDQVQYLENKLVNFDDTTSTQIAIVIINNFAGYTKAEYADLVGEEWGVGHKDKDNGVLILLKPKTIREKGEVHIAVGYGLEGAVPDAIAKRIVENEMIPKFRSNDYFGGLDAAANTLMSLATGEFTADEYAKKGQPGGWIVIFPFLAFLIAFLFISAARRAPYAGGKNLPFWAMLLLLGSMNSRRSYSGKWNHFNSGTGSFGGFHGGSGGGFGGFGGGGFGGGGAGGSW